MAKNTANLAEWKIEDFVNYFSNNNRLFGNSETFDDIAGLSKELNKFENQKISYDMVYDRTQMLQKLIDTAVEYDNTHSNPHTSTGKERKEVINAFKAFCEKEKEYTDLSANVKFFEGKSLQEMKKGVDFKQVTELYDKAAEWEKEKMTEENVIAHTNALSKALQATEIFLKYQPKAVMFKKVKEREMIQDSWNKYQPCISSMRDLRTVRAMIKEGKSWDDLHALKEATAELTGKETKVGANVSQRFKITHNGKTGFFTEETYVQNYEDMVDDYFKEHNKTKEDILLGRNRDIFDDKLLTIDGYGKKYLASCRIWDNMPDSVQKREVQQVLALGESNLQLIFKIFNTAKENLSEEKWNDSKEREKQILDCIKNPEKYSMVKDNCAFIHDIKKNILKNVDFFIEIANKKEDFKENGYMLEIDKRVYGKMLQQDLHTKEGKERYQACRELLDNPKAKGKATNIMKRLNSLDTGHSAGLFSGKSELTSRNIATSRMAELLGVGNLIAYSEKMTVNVNGKSISGCFMEFAEGIDTQTKDMYELNKISNTSIEIGGGFSRDASNLRLFDVICAQQDRHAGNMFVKLGEPDEKGVRKIIGLQGIDNDLSFSTKDVNKSSEKSIIDKINFVDDAFAKNVEALTKDKIEYVMGDILNSDEIDALMTRIEQVKKHIKENAIRLETEDDWKLDKYPKDTDISKLKENEQEYAKKYINAVKDIEDAQKGSNSWEIFRYDEAKVANNFLNRSKDYEKMINEETELFGDVSNMFEQAEKEANVSEKKQPAANNRPKERMSFKDLAEKKEKKPAFKTAQPSQNQKEKKSVVIGANRGMGKK